jgi:hypothetical protein
VSAEADGKSYGVRKAPVEIFYEPGFEFVSVAGVDTAASLRWQVDDDDFVGRSEH